MAVARARVMDVRLSEHGWVHANPAPSREMGAGSSRQPQVAGRRKYLGTYTLMNGGVTQQARAVNRDNQFQGLQIDW